eukprot:jgi/Psemu1/282696/fgenesh1_pg.12_\
MSEENNNGDVIHDLEPVSVQGTDGAVGGNERDLDSEIKRSGCHQAEERMSLKDRLLELQTVLNQVRKVNSTYKMKSTITLSGMQVELECIRDDKQFLIQKRFELIKKLQALEESFRLKEAELVTLQSMIGEA